MQLRVRAARRRLLLRFPLVLVSAVLIAAIRAPSVSAAGFHQYAHAWDNSAGSTAYTGLSVYRPDVTISGIPSDGCSSPITGTPVYQTEWLYALSPAYLELGTGHQCGDSFAYWFWGYQAAGGGWHLLGYQMISTRSNHTFQIETDPCSGHYCYVFKVDGTIKNQDLSGSHGSNVDTGLESYTPSAVVQAYSHGSLAYRLNDGTSWTSWSGEDGSQVNTPTMCGHWANPTTWHAAENVVGC